jgi:23S rRNA G2069 N7-methylase RlmK/C1962 C5-methylase RlmI
MEHRKGSEQAELLNILVNLGEKTNLLLERIESRISAVDAPSAEQADATRQVIGRLDRLEGLAQDGLGELRVVSLYATQMTRRFERELADLRARVDGPPAPPPADEPPGES